MSKIRPIKSINFKGEVYKLSIESSNHNKFKRDKTEHPEYFDYLNWKTIDDIKFEKRIKYQRLEKIKKINNL